jgi:hypothetical protein
MIFGTFLPRASNPNPLTACKITSENHHVLPRYVSSFKPLPRVPSSLSFKLVTNSEAMLGLIKHTYGPWCNHCPSRHQSPHRLLFVQRECPA